MADTSNTGGGVPPGAPGHPGGSHVGRAVVVLVVFVVVTVLLVGGIHGSSSSSASGTTPTTHPTPTTTTTTVPPVAPNKVPVLVANGSGTSGLAGSTSNQLQAAGWDVLPPVNATTTNIPDTTVYYAAGSKAPATTIATQLHLPVTSVQPLTTSTPVATVGTGDVVVVLGVDQAKATAGTP